MPMALFKRDCNNYKMKSHSDEILVVSNISSQKLVNPVGIKHLVPTELIKCFVSCYLPILYAYGTLIKEIVMIKSKMKSHSDKIWVVPNISFHKLENPATM